MRRFNDVEWSRPKPEPEPNLSRTSSTPRRSMGALITQSLIDVAIAEERRFNRQVMAGVLAEVNDALERAVRSLTVELADLKAALAEVQLAFATDRTQALDLPNPLSKRAGSELRIDAGLPASLGLVVQALCSSTTSALGAAGIEQNVPHASMSLRRFSRASPRR
jgi:hypothetical protein